MTDITERVILAIVGILILFVTLTLTGCRSEPTSRPICGVASEDSRSAPGPGWDYHGHCWFPPGHPENKLD